MDLPLNFVSVPYLLNPFWRFSLNFIQMFRSVRRCAEHITQLPRLKFKVTGQGINPLNFVSAPFILNPFWQFLLNFNLMFLFVSRRAEHMTQLPRLKVKVMRLNREFHVRSISHQPFLRFSLNLTQMLLSMSCCAD